MPADLNDRYHVPDPKSFEGPIAEDEFDLNMAKEDDVEEKRRAADAKASKAWRALRVTAKTRLNIFDEIDTNAETLRPLFEVGNEENRSEPGVEDAEDAQVDAKPSLALQSAGEDEQAHGESVPSTLNT
jgi:THO complex subunit 1